MRQYEIYRSRREVWTLVVEPTAVWVLEVDADGEARQILSLEDFRQSEQGQRLAMELEGALQRASIDA